MPEHGLCTSSGAKALHPEISDRVWVADIRYLLNFLDQDLDFIICSAVIQHIAPDLVFGVTLPELARVLKPNGVLQLMFKNGHGVKTVFDRDYGVERSFHLYHEDETLATLSLCGVELLEAKNPDLLGELMYFTDPKLVDHSVFYARKVSQLGSQ